MYLAPPWVQSWLPACSDCPCDQLWACRSYIKRKYIYTYQRILMVKVFCNNPYVEGALWYFRNKMGLTTFICLNFNFWQTHLLGKCLFLKLYSLLQTFGWKILTRLPKSTSHVIKECHMPQRTHSTRNIR